MAIRPLLIALASLIALLCTPVQAGTILVFGDSLSAAYGLRVEDGWVAQLERQQLAAYNQARARGQQGRHEKKTRAEWRLVNVSVSGETTSGGLARLPAALQQHHPDLVILELGANDGLRGQPLATMRNNLQRMIRLIRDSGARVLLLGVQIPPNYGPRYTKEFADSFSQIAVAESIACVPFFLAAVASDISHFQPDQLHPNAGAQPAIANTVWQALQPLLDQPS